MEHVKEASKGYEGDRKVNGCGMNWTTRNVSLEGTEEGGKMLFTWP